MWTTVDDRRPGWRNGRRGGLKIRYLHGCVGSIPAPGTTFVPMCTECARTFSLALAPGRNIGLVSQFDVHHSPGYPMTLARRQPPCGIESKSTIHA